MPGDVQDLPPYLLPLRIHTAYYDSREFAPTISAPMERCRWYNMQIYYSPTSPERLSEANHLRTDSVPDETFNRYPLGYTRLRRLQFQVNPNFHTQKENFKGSIVVFVQLAIGVIYELKLHKAITTDPLHIRCVPAPSDENRKASRTLLERRAVLACVLLTSSISSTLKTVEPLRWTSHMDDCLLELEKQKADPLDELLVHLVKIQRVVDRANEAENSGVQSAPSTPYDIRPTLYPQALLVHLDSIAEQIPASVKQMPILIFQLSSALLVLAELALAGDPTVTTTTSGPNLQRLRYLELALQSIKTWMKFYYTLPSAFMRHISMTTMLQFRFCAGMLFVLTTLNEPAWLSREEVRAEVDILGVMDHAARMYSEVAAAVGLDNGPTDVKGLDLFTLASGRSAKLRAAWAAQLELPAERVQAVQMCSDELDAAPALPAPEVGEFSEVYAGMEELNWKEVDWFIDSLFVL
ncbi:hypothetical protein LTR86_007503 [Recurvomyces mirabilis]|nr:hypothetical protein LTR86_007503 [Recurvomyces mirabilis]